MARTRRGRGADLRRQERRTDLRQGNRDGRRRQPTLTDVAPYGQLEAVTQLFAPYPDGLAYLGRSTMEAEFVGYRRRTGATLEERARLNEQILAGERSVRHHRELVAGAELPLTLTELMPRNSAESGRDGEWLRRRREVMRARRIDSARQELMRGIRALESLRARRAEACQILDREFDASRATARQIAERTAERIATYWQGVVATHPDGKHLSTVLPTLAPDLPGWVTVDFQCGQPLLPGEPGLDHDHERDREYSDGDGDNDNDNDNDIDLDDGDGNDGDGEAAA